MPYDLSKTLVIGISSTALYDLSGVDREFQEAYRKNSQEAVSAYRTKMLQLEEEDLLEGTGYPLIKALLGLNKHTPGGEPPLVEVVVMSRNSPETGLRILNSIRKGELGISRTAFTGGEPVTDYLKSFDVDLFLTTSAPDAQRVIDAGGCAAAVVYPPPSSSVKLREDQVRIAFDGDAVLFDDSSEILFKKKGLDAFHEVEDAATNIPMLEGPHASLLKKLGELQNRLPVSVETGPVRIALVTARNSPADRRAILTMRHWGVYVDEAFFLGGLDKREVLVAFRPHIFFDDQPVHLDDTSKVVAAARVPYRSDSELFIGPRKPPGPPAT
jgi:5'-nucleotidase